VIGADGARRLLVVEDSEPDVELLREALRGGSSDLAIDVVRYGEEALDFLHRRAPFDGALRPDVIMLDLNLPGMTGLEVLAALRASAEPDLRRLPVIVFTTSSAAADVQAAYDLHASSFVTKPTAFDEYLSVVATFCEFWLRVARLPTDF
jgi:CheY-like chemotaxis protein